jgi:oligoribonuclease (3'-5' exoribonuclease)
MKEIIIECTEIVKDNHLQVVAVVFVVVVEAETNFSLVGNIS